MLERLRLDRRKRLALAYDVVATLLAFAASLFICATNAEPSGTARLPGASPLIALAFFASIVFVSMRLYDGQWAQGTRPDLLKVVKAITVLAAGLALVDDIVVSAPVAQKAPVGFGTIVLFWLFGTALLTIPRRILHLVRRSPAAAPVQPAVVPPAQSRACIRWSMTPGPVRAPCRKSERRVSPSDLPR